MSGSESLDPKEPGDSSPHELGVYVRMYVCVQYINYLHISTVYGS